MKDINTIRKISYLKLKAKYYQLLAYREIENSCLIQNFETAKEISKTYFTQDGHDEENLKIYDWEYQTLKYCLNNMKECKRLDEEIEKTKIKVLKAKSKIEEI